MIELFKFSLPSKDDISFEKAWPDFRMFAIRRHGRQMYGEVPYAYHLAMVEAILGDYGFTSHDYQVAAWLHDSVEDTDVTLDMINGLYGGTVVSMVWACTGEGENRKARAESIYKKLEQYPIAAPVKVADRLANTLVSSGKTPLGKEPTRQLDMYLAEWDEFKARVSPLMGDHHNSRLLWDALASTVEEAKEARQKPADP